MTIQERWFEEVWNQGREATIDELLDPNAKGHGLSGPDGKEVDSVGAFKEFYQLFRAALSDIHVAVEDTVTEGDLAVARCVVTAKHTGEGLGKSPKGRPLRFTGITIVRVKDGKIVESWNNYDFMTMYQQMD